MSTLQWSDSLALDLPFMDDTHREFVDLLAIVVNAPDELLLEAWQTLIAHTDDHFGREDQWMKDTHFSSSNCHTTQHDVILQVMREGAKRGQAGDLAMVRQMAYELCIWFPQHAQSMDAALALQTVRSKAAEWNIDKLRIGASGGSAGACSSLWLAFHDDMADPKSSDPIARESTRLYTAAVNGPQTTLDPKQMREWTPNSKYGGHAFSKNGEFKNFDDFVAARERILPWINEYSPYALVTSDDPPVYCLFGAPPAIGQEQKDPTHTANFGVKLQEHCKEFGVGCELVYPGAPNVKHKSEAEYLIDRLKAPAVK